MTYTVIVAAPAARDLRKLPEDARRRIGRRIDALAGDPRPHGVRQLEGLPELYRVRIGEYRVIYQTQDRELLVLVVRGGGLAWAAGAGRGQRAGSRRG